MKLEYARGSIFYCNLPEIQGYHSVEKGYRPVVIVSSLAGIISSDIVMVCPLTTKRKKLSCNVDITYGNSQILCNQIMTVPKRALTVRIGRISEKEMLEMDTAILVSLGIAPSVTDKIQKSQEDLANAKKDVALLQQLLPEAKSLIAKLSEVTKRVEGTKVIKRVKRKPEEIEAFVREWNDPHNNKREVAEAFGFNTYSAAYQFWKKHKC